MPGSNKKQVLFRHFLWNVQKFTSSEENIFAVLLVFLWEMPVMTVDGEVHAKMTPEAALALLEEIRAKEERAV